ncbi:protein kinase superfamily protein [Actinidia rufa]|uniref:non-specific serine/threonine protein kinase n=1 Tax=Actinidia rufa TaxID=165716 RepID=A0A7J0EMX7_9ERIC|nr:protein kinase superfamily protein [Actinidia rufa]
MSLCPLPIIISLYFFLHHLIIPVAGAIYYPLDNIAVNCGFSGNSTAADGRQWIGDNGSKYITSHAGHYTLLSNFSAALTSDALGLPSFAKEFCANVEENQRLIISFTPSQCSSTDEVYAFVNGIEVISMPTGLYHTQEGEEGAHVVGKKRHFSIDKNTALEKAFRLNVGGSSILSLQDTGMFREWSGDSNYLLESSVLPATTTSRIEYTNIPAYIAPQKVYQTSWSIVPDKQANKTFNFTWKLPVDLGFRYLLRFHFCELGYKIKERGNAGFSIFVNEEVAEAKSDIIEWSGQNGVAVYRDYVVMMEGDRMEGKRDLLIALCPHKIDNYDWNEQIDAILKGLEVFKLSNHDKNLAGVNPEPLVCASTSGKPNPRKLVFASGGNAIATGVVVLLTMVNIIVYNLRLLSEKVEEKYLSSLPSEGLCRRFSLAEILSVTNNFDDELVVGRGGFGKVYKAVIDSGETNVAIKRLNLKSRQGADEFWTEIEMLSNLRHTHLVSLIGYCDERSEMILVYEYMEYGTLADHLYKINTDGTVTSLCHLSWEQRVKICIGAARGLDYLHTGTRHGIIHRDVKSTNILLDKDWVSKISDFGLCKTGSASHSRTHVSTDVKGTFGYCFRDRRGPTQSSPMGATVHGRKTIRSFTHFEDQITPKRLMLFAEVAIKCLHRRPNGRPTMANVLRRRKKRRTLMLLGLVDEQIDENIQDYNSLPVASIPSTSTSTSTSTLVQYNENSHRQKRSKGMFNNVIQSSLTFLAKAAETRYLNANNREKCAPNETQNSSDNPDPLPLQSKAPCQLLQFTFQELKFATRNFRPDNVLGEGRFGSAFKGWIEENGTAPAKPGTGITVVVKRLTPDYRKGQREWLVSRFSALGDIVLPWPNRIKIALGAAKGLTFLHGCPEPVIFGDFKTSNVLLDSEYNVKLSDFGLAKSRLHDYTTYVPTLITAALYYAAPEYIATGLWTSKSDVYGFGVVLLEILTGRRSIDYGRPSRERNLVDWARRYLAVKRKVYQLVDPCLERNYSREGVQKVAQLAYNCINANPKSRPSMDETVKILSSLQDLNDL